MQTQIETLSRT